MPRSVGSGQGGDAARWGSVFARLIASGHKASELGDYTMRQIRLYHEQAQRLSFAHRAALCLDMAHAHAGGKPAQKHIKALEDFARGEQ